MLRPLRDLVFLIVVLGGTLAGSQVPLLVDAYAQRLGGALDEASRTLAGFERAAASLGMSFEQYLAEHRSSDAPSVRATGVELDRLTERVARLAELAQSLQAAGPWSRPLAVLRDRDDALFGNAVAEWRPSLTVDPRWGLIGLAIGWLLHATGGGAVAAVQRRRRRRIPAPPLSPPSHPLGRLPRGTPRHPP